MYAHHHPLVERTILTTDSNVLAEIGRKYHCEVPFIRSSQLASDTASSADVILDVIERCHLANDQNILLLEPTSPYRTFNDLFELTKIFQNDCDCTKIVSVSPAISTSYQFQYFRDTSMSGSLKPVFDFNKTSYLRRQDIESVFYLDGTFYASNVSSFKSSPTFLDKNTKSIQSSFLSSFEIDDINDFNLYEAIFSFMGPPFEVQLM